MKPSFFQRSFAIVLSLSLLMGTAPQSWAQTDLGAEVRSYLESREGLMSLDDVLTEEALVERMLTTLKDHRNEFPAQGEEIFLLEYYQLADMPMGVKTALLKAIESFRAADLGLTVEQRTYLANRDGLMSLEDVESLEKLKALFFDALDTHRNEFNVSSRLEVEAYLTDYFDLRGAVPTNIQRTRSAAVDAFLSADGIPSTLDERVRNYLLTRSSLRSLDDVTSLNQLEDLFVEVLKIHEQEISQVSEAAVLSYLDSYFDLTGEIPAEVKDRRLKAVKRFMAVTTGSLKPEEKTYLETRGGMMMLDDIRDLETLENRFLETLRVHKDEFEAGQAESYLVRYYDLTGNIPPNIIDRIKNAVQRFSQIAHKGLTPEVVVYLRGLGSADFNQVSNEDQLVEIFANRLMRQYEAIKASPSVNEDIFALGKEVGYLMGVYSMVEADVPEAVMAAIRQAIARVKNAMGGNMGPQLPCPDCDDLKKRVRALEAQKEAKAEESRDLAEEFHDLKKQVNDALDRVIEDSGCRPGQDVSGAASSATGLVYGRPFACDSNAKVSDMTNALNEFWRKHRDSELDRKVKDVEERLKKVIEEVNDLTAKLNEAKKALDDCIAKAKLIRECLRILGGLVGDDSNDSPIISSFTFQQPTDARLTTPFREVNSSRLISLSERFDGVSEQQVDINRFADVRSKSERVKRAIRYLTNRVPLFQGNEGGESFGADERVLRAVIAETLKRLGSMGTIEGYVDPEIDFSRRLTDVEGGVWFEEAMRLAIDKGVFKPQNDSVRPADDLNWAELVTVIRRFAGLEPIVPNTDPFPSVPAGEWFSQEFFTLKEAGLLDDFEDIDPIARPSKADLALIIHRLLSQQEAITR